jgi:chemotaxis protein histidine kinase CheA
MSDIEHVQDLLRRVARRLRLQRALEGIGTMSILSGAWALVAVFLLKVRHLEPDVVLQVVAIAVLFPAAALLAALLRPVRPATAAQIVDRRLGLKDLLGSAHDFSLRREGELSPYAEYTVERAARRARDVRPRDALPLRFPRTLGVFGAQLVVLVVLALLPRFPEPEPAQAAAPPAEVQGMAVAFDELDGINQVLQEVHQEALDEQIDEVAQAAEEFNKLLQDLADQRLPYREALDRIAALEQKLDREPWEPDPEAEQFLKQIGRDLAKAEVTKEAGKALEEQDLRQARDEARKAAEKVEREPPDQRRLEELRRALEQAAKRQPPDADSRLERLEQEQRRLKQKQEKSSSEATKRRLKQNERELERLQRNLERQREKQRQLERLSRDLQRSAESLNLEGQEELQQLLEQLGEDLNRMAREQTTEEQMRQLQQRLEELRRLLQQLQRGGKGFKARLEQFSKGAKCGGKGGGSGENDGDGGGKSISLTPGGRDGQALLPLKMPGSGSGQKQGQGQGQDRPDGGEGPGIGDAPDPDVFGDETKIKAQYTDVQVSPQQGDGPAKSEVIETAADQGFATPGYSEVHETYERHAESLLDQQDVPPGYRRYIRQYFERIRPR